jgi:hypothetical protein
MVSGSSLVVANMMPLKAYMIVNFRARGISRGARKLARISTLIIKKNKKLETFSTPNNSEPS